MWGQLTGDWHFCVCTWENCNHLNIMDAAEDYGWDRCDKKGSDWFCGNPTPTSRNTVGNGCTYVGVGGLPDQTHPPNQQRTLNRLPTETPVQIFC